MIYAGIDIAKFNHYAAVISSDGLVLTEPFEFSNDGDGFQRRSAERSDYAYLGNDYARVFEGTTKVTAIVDLKTKKEIVKTTGDLWAREQYIEETDGNTKRYYTYTGKKFFEK